MAYQELREKVVAHGGVLTVDMGVLRDVHGAGKLGVHVRVNIAKDLRASGLGHMPADLPTYQHECVRLWAIGTPAGDLAEAFAKVDPETDATIREAVDADSAATVDRIRELVCA